LHQKFYDVYIPGAAGVDHIKIDGNQTWGANWIMDATMASPSGLWRIPRINDLSILIA
jgi:hypothetical protein